MLVIWLVKAKQNNSIGILAEVIKLLDILIVIPVKNSKNAPNFISPGALPQSMLEELIMFPSSLAGFKGFTSEQRWGGEGKGGQTKGRKRK